VKVIRAGLLVALLSYLVMTLSFDGQRQRVLWMLMAVIFASLQDGTFGVGGLRVVTTDTTQAPLPGAARTSVV
jgi:hypothetical protein